MILTIDFYKHEFLAQPLILARIKDASDPLDELDEETRAILNGTMAPAPPRPPRARLGIHFMMHALLFLESHVTLFKLDFTVISTTH